MSFDRALSRRAKVDRIPANRRLSTSEFLTSWRGKQLLEDLAALQNDESDILWKVDSSGGHFQSGIALCGAFVRSSPLVIGLVSGKACSAAFMALQGCRLRLATPSSMLQIHYPEWINFDEELRFDTCEAEYIERQRIFFRERHPGAVENTERVMKILLVRSRLDRDALAAHLEAAKPMTPDEAIALGFLDDVCAEEQTRDTASSS